VVGWTGVTNSNAAVPGDAVETDSELRGRQSISVALPALTTLQSTVAAVLAVPGVVRVAPGYPTPGGPGSSIENPTGSTDSWGNPPHSISMVVDGGTDAAVAQAIYAKRGIGCYTNGTTSVSVADPNTGFAITISFYRPTLLSTYVDIVLAGYGSTPTTAQMTAVQTAVVNYLNSLEIGETISYGALIYEVMSVNANLSAPSFGVSSLKLGTTVDASTTATFGSGSGTITVASATGIANGQLVVGAGIAPHTYVTLVSGTTISLSVNTTAAETASPVTFVTVAAADVAMPDFHTVAFSAAADVGVSHT